MGNSSIVKATLAVLNLLASQGLIIHQYRVGKPIPHNGRTNMLQRLLRPSLLPLAKYSLVDNAVQCWTTTAVQMRFASPWMCCLWWSTELVCGRAIPARIIQRTKLVSLVPTAVSSAGILSLSLPSSFAEDRSD